MGKKFFRALAMHGGITVPSKPKKPCAYPGCPALVARRYCEEHARKVNSDYEKFSRDKQTKRRYGRAWKRIRDKYALRSIRSVSCVLNVDLQFRWKRFTTRSR